MIVWITHVKVGHRQTPYKQKTRPRAGFFVCVARIALTSLWPFPIMCAVADVCVEYGSLAQLVEQWTLNPLVEGSNPSRPTSKIKACSDAGFIYLLLRRLLITCTHVIPVECHRDRHEALCYKP